jgi:hypothetical protein
MNKQHVSFQIKDSVIVSLNEVDAKAYTDGIEQLKNSQKEKSDDPIDTEMSEFQILRGIDQLRASEQLEIAAVLEMLNTKINALAQRIRLHENSKPELGMQPPQTVSISTAGMGLGVSNEIAKNQPLQIKLILLPQLLYIPIFGEAVECIKDEDTFPPFPYKLLVKFEFMLEEDIDKLVQHMLRKQSEFLRKKRLNANEGPMTY